MPETRWLIANLRFCVFDNKRTNREVRMNFKLLKQASQKTFLGAIGAAALSIVAIGAAQADPVTVVSWGGSYGKAQDAALFTDASKNSGIEINRESGASMSKVMLQVESGAVTWDLVVSGSGGCAAAAAKGALEKIDFNVVDVSNFLPNTYTDYCIV
jgi:putative spermidine/putrescine transport system substrate-binding protein